MLLAVFSDSHGDDQAMRRAVERCRPNHIFFLGDGVRDAAQIARSFPAIPMTILRGNCDFDTACPDRALIELDGVRIFAAHGHNHGVKLSLDGFCNSVCCSGARLGLFGHTHRPLLRDMAGVTLMNPGSIGNLSSPTFGLVTIENGDFQCKIVHINEDF